MASESSGKIGVSTATITGMNAMIGAGIFTAPAILASNVGPAGILTYLFVVCSVWFIAQSLSRVASLFPLEGSFYTYAKQWGGHLVGILAGSSYIVGLTIGMGLLSRIAGQFLLPFFPCTSSEALGLIALICLVILNMFGSALSQLGQRILIVCTVLPLLIIIIMCLTKADLSLLTPFAPFGFGNAMRATRMVIFGFFGFESAASLFSIVKNPERNVPRALTYSILLVGAIYIIFVGSMIVSIPLSLFSSAEVPLTEILKEVFPHATWIITIVHFSILSAVLGTIHSMIWGSSNLLIALVKKLKSNAAQSISRAGLFNHRSSVFFIGACTLVSFLTLKNIDLFFDLTSLFIISAFILSMITLLTIKKEWRSGQNIKTILGISTALMMLIFSVQGIIQHITKLIH